MHRLLVLSLCLFGRTLAGNPLQDWLTADYTRPNLLELARELNLTRCVENMEKVGINRVINHEGFFTLFCPTNDAFDREKFYPGEDTLTDKMRLHVARGWFNSSSFNNEVKFKTLLSKRSVRINIYTSGKFSTMTANGRGIVEVDHVARNGVIHVLYDVMSSVYSRAGSVVSEIDECCPQHSTFLDLVDKAGMYQLLDTTEPVTLLAPLNVAFERLHPDFVIHLKKNITMLTQVLKSHVIPGTWYTAGLSNGDQLKTMSGVKVPVTKGSNGEVRFSIARATLTDVTAGNGVVHSVDSVIFPRWMREQIQSDLNITSEDAFHYNFGLPSPQKHLVALCEELGLTSFVSMLKNHGVDHVINHEGQFTLFAPTNDAFLIKDPYPVDYSARDKVLFHIARGEIVDANIYNGLHVRSLLSHRDIEINVYDDGKGGRIITANGRRVELTEHRAHNGVVHVIDRVMDSVPERHGTVDMEVGRASEHSIFYRMMRKTRIYKVINKLETITVFVPTNKAIIASLDDAQLQRVSRDRQAMWHFVMRHVVPSTWYSHGLATTPVLKNLMDDTLTFSGNSTELRVNDARVTLPDWTAINGAFHRIDGVLFADKV